MLNNNFLGLKIYAFFTLLFIHSARVAHPLTTFFFYQLWLDFLYNYPRKMSYKLTYFDFKGRGEAIRLLLATAGVKFADDRVKLENWPSIKPRKRLTSPLILS